MIKKITKYFRDAVVSQKTQRVEIGKDSEKVSFDTIQNGIVDIETCGRLFRGKCKRTLSLSNDADADAEVKNGGRQIKVIIALQVVNVRASGGMKHESDIADLTGTFFLPANLSDTGILSLETDSLPWIPRDLLSPVMDDTLIVGKLLDVDGYIMLQTKELADIRETGDWDKYISFAQGFWWAVNGTTLSDEFIYNYADGKQPLFLDQFSYIIPDNTISSTHHIKKLYEYALTEDQSYNNLYRTVVNLTPQAERSIIPNDLSRMLDHTGQMHGSYPLSTSQREAVNHFTAMEEGEVLAVNGPPGTGKTTLLQSIVANMMVTRALGKADAPIIVATSTNNQAVTNIIESFASTGHTRHPKQIDVHWIQNKDSFATYFPSSKKIKNARDKGYQVTDKNMGHSVSDWELEKNRDQSIQNVLAHCEDLFETDGMTIEQCRDCLHELLVDLDSGRREMLSLSDSIPFDISIPSDSAQSRRIVEDELLSCENRENNFMHRLNAWRKLWGKLLLYRIFSFILEVKKRLSVKMSVFRTLDEHDLPEGAFSFKEIELYYEHKLRGNRLKYQGYQAAKKLLDIAHSFESYDIHVLASQGEKVSLSLSFLDDLFDTNIRFYEFWLSIHYFACRWLDREYKMEDDELFKSTYPAMMKKYKRLCMLTPCLVMTFFMLPNNFTWYKDKYLYNFIDLLIVDEAGQVSPEIGAASFLLAKKALVVGDVYQIEPVWSVSRELDMALAIDCGVVSCREFSLLEENGLNTSESSLMKIADNACAYSKFGKKGLLLTEHRRCYDELISYCNELVYDGKLEPKRGLSAKDTHYPFPGQPTLDHIQVSTTKSERRKTSRYNLSEAQCIRTWLMENFENIKAVYPNDPVSTLVGVITPFTDQADTIRKELSDIPIDVGTVHTFQGGERKIILFSTVYGSEDGCAFLDFKPNLMNVAMSRAKDRFIVFGDIGCLNASGKTPSSLLRAFIQHESR
jgi:energy-coupling factor transporter ATP-binding protein EcfA2